MKPREIWLTNAKATAREVWREQNRALARKRTEALEKQQQARRQSHMVPTAPEDGAA